MKRLVSLLVSLFVWAAAHAPAAVLVELNPTNGQITGAAGTTVGWGFTISSNTHFLLVNGIDFLPAPSMGVFNDMISFRPSLFVVGPGPGENPVITEVFDLLAETGLANFAINPGIPDGTTAIGTIYFNYSLYTVSPNDPLFDPGLHAFDVGLTIALPAQITVVAAPPGSGVPEPSTFALGGLALAGLWWRRRGSPRLSMVRPHLSRGSCRLTKHTGTRPRSWGQVEAGFSGETASSAGRQKRGLR